MLNKKLKDLKHLGADFKVIITTTDECAYFIELQHDEELIVIQDKHQEPVQYKSLDEIYEILRKYHIYKATLRQNMPYDEMIGTGSEGAQIVEMEINIPE